MQNKLLRGISDNSNSSSIHLLLIPMMYSFPNSSFPVMTSKYFWTYYYFDVGIINIVVAYVLSLSNNFVLLDCGKYLYFGPTSKGLFSNCIILIVSLHDPSQDNKLLDVSGVVLILFDKLPVKLSLDASSLA